MCEASHLAWHTGSSEKVNFPWSCHNCLSSYAPHGQTCSKGHVWPEIRYQRAGSPFSICISHPRPRFLLLKKETRPLKCTCQTTLIPFFGFCRGHVTQVGRSPTLSLSRWPCFTKTRFVVVSIFEITEPESSDHVIWALTGKKGARTVLMIYGLCQPWPSQRRL